jgi:integrase
VVVPAFTRQGHDRPPNGAFSNFSATHSLAARRSLGHAGDVDPDMGRARLSYRRAAELFKAASGGRTLHKLRQSRLTHLAEAGENISLIKALSRHRSLRSLERYVNPSNEAVARLAARHDPNRRGT